jgi:hypothetical protein
MGAIRTGTCIEHNNALQTQQAFPDQEQIRDEESLE